MTVDQLIAKLRPIGSCEVDFSILSLVHEFRSERRKIQETLVAAAGRRLGARVSLSRYYQGDFTSHRNIPPELLFANHGDSDYVRIRLLPQEKPCASSR
jgi:hypothetical protein